MQGKKNIGVIKMTNEVKVMVIGLDGAPFHVLFSLAKQRAIPNFTKLMENGCFGVLYSTIPPISPVAWPSFVTGEVPGKHGMFDFWRLLEGGSVALHTSASIRGRTFWDMLGEAGKKVVLLNVPWTFPPYKVNGIMVSGFPSPKNRVESHPPEFISLLESKIGDYYVDISYPKSDYERLDERSFLDEIYAVTRKRAEAIYYLTENYDWDFFMAVFTSLDRMQHVLFGYFDKESPIYNEEKRQILIKYYEEIDGILGRVISLIDENTILIIVSDHGFEPLYKYVGINNFLIQGAFIESRRNKQVFTKENITDFLRKIKIEDIGKIFPGKILNIAQKIIPSKIDFSTSTAYGTYTSSVSINKAFLRTERAYEDTKRRLIDFFYSISDEETGEKIVEKVYTQDEACSGNHLDKAPDLTIVFKKGYEPKRWAKSTIEPIKRIRNRNVKTGTHMGSSARRGIFIASGKGITKNFSLEANIVDVAPTILHMLGAPVLSSMDGRVLQEIFAPDSNFKKTRIKYLKASMKKEEKEYKWSEEEEEEIKKRLRRLGYID